MCLQQSSIELTDWGSAVSTALAQHEGGVETSLQSPGAQDGAGHLRGWGWWCQQSGVLAWPPSHPQGREAPKIFPGFCGLAVFSYKERGVEGEEWLSTATETAPASRRMEKKGTITSSPGDGFGLKSAASPHPARRKQGGWEDLP